jgi:phosphate transport system substrate-binding protein
MFAIMKKMIVLSLLMAIALTGWAGPVGAAAFDPQKAISVVSREDGSGTRGAFIELVGLELRGPDGSRKDLTSKDAIIAKQTDVMMTNIAGDAYAIGYISLGSLNDMVKPLAVGGAAATAANVKNGSYTLARPFYVAHKQDLSGQGKDFIDFILSQPGQSVVGKRYVALSDAAPAYSGGKISGKIVVAGSSSVTPVMEELKEAYMLLNPGVVIEIQMSDSTAGLSGAMEGTCDIGMASRELKDSEKARLTARQIAIDGIVVIVNPNNPLSNLSKEQIKAIFMGQAEKWSDVSK